MSGPRTAPRSSSPPPPFPSPILDKEPPFVAQSGPSYPLTLPVHSQSRPTHIHQPLVHPTLLFPPPHSAPHYQIHFASSETSHPPNMDRYSITNIADRSLRGTDKYPPLDHRRMSEPAMYGNSQSSYPTNTVNLSNARHHQLLHQYPSVPSQSYGALSSPLPRPSLPRLTGGSPWKEDHQLPLHSYDSIELEEPLSPLNPTFSGGESPPPTTMSGMAFGSLHEDYGPSPPGTGTSTSSNAPLTLHQVHSVGESSSASNSKQYSFVALPGNTIQKRPRRRYDEIERLYHCSWPDCTKSYGTLNHLNAHITMQKHGQKRSPNEFKELRKQWRKAKKEEAEARALDAVRHGSHQTQHPSQHHTFSHSMSDADYQSHNLYGHHPPRSAQSIGPLDDLHDSLTHQRDIYPRRSQRYGSFVSPHPQHCGQTYQHPPTHSPNIPINRLPANSTLLAPLPGYEPSTMSSAPDFDAYDLYRNDSRQRTGHTSHSGRVRPRSSHDRDFP